MLYERAARLVASAREANEAVQRLDNTPRGLVRVSVPPGLGRQASFTSMLLRFLKRFPEVQLEVVEDARFVDLVGEGIDIALRGGSQRDSLLIQRRLITTNMVAAASPAYLDQYGRPTTPEQMAQHNCLIGMAGGNRPFTAWPLRDGGTFKVNGRLATNDLQARIRASIEGFGIVLMPEGLRDDRFPDELEILLPETVGQVVHLSLVYVERALMPPKLRAFIDHCVAWFGSHDVVGTTRQTLVQEEALTEMILPVSKSASGEQR